MSFIFKSEREWDKLSNFWRFYGDRDQHNALWDAERKIYEGGNFRAVQSFYAKGIANFPVAGFNTSWLNSPVQQGLFSFGKYGGTYTTSPIPTRDDNFLPIEKNTSNVWVKNDDLDIYYQIPDTEYYYPNLSQFSTIKDFFTPKVNFSFVDQFDAEIVIASFNIKYSFSDFIFISSGNSIKIFKINASNDKGVLIFDEIIKNKSLTDVENIFSMQVKNSFLYMACGNDGIAVYFFSENIFSRANEDYPFPEKIKHISVNDGLCFAATDQPENKVYVLDSTVPSVIGNLSQIMLPGTPILPPSGIGFDQDSEVVGMLTFQSSLLIFRGVGSTYEIENHSYLDFSNISLVDGFFNKISNSSPTAKISSWMHSQGSFQLFIKWDDGGSNYIDLFDVSNPQSPSKRNINKIEPEQARTPDGNVHILDFSIGYDLSTLVLLTNRTTTSNQAYFFYDISDPINTKLINYDGWPELPIQETHTSFGLLPNDSMFSFDPTAQRINFFESHLDIGGKVTHTFSDLSEIDSSYLVHLNSHLYDWMGQIGANLNPRGFSDMSWELTYNQEKDSYTFKIIDFNYEVNINATTFFKKDLFDGDKFFQSEIIELGENGDILRLRDFNNASPGFIDIGGTDYPLEFELILKSKKEDNVFGAIQEEVFVSIDISIIDPILLIEVKANGIAGSGFELYRNFTGKALTIREDMPIPFIVPKIVKPNETNSSLSSNFILIPIRYNLGGNVDRGFVVVQNMGSENFDQNIISEFPSWIDVGSDNLNSYGRKPPTTQDEEFFIMSNSNFFKGRYKVNSTFPKVNIVTIQTMTSGGIEDSFGTSPTPEFTNYFQTFDSTFLVNEGQFYAAFSNGSSKVFIKESNGSSVNKVDITSFLGKIFYLSSSANIGSENHNTWFLVVDGYVGDENNDGFLIISKYINSLDLFVSSITTPANSPESFFVYSPKSKQNIDSISFGSSRDRGVSDNFLNLSSLFVGFFFAEISGDDPETFFQNIYELHEKVLTDVTSEDQKVFSLYDSENPEDYEKKYSEHEGLVAFAYDPELDHVFAPMAFENLSFLSKTFSPVVGGDQDRLDSQEFYEEISGMMYAFTHGANISPMKVGLNIFMGMPINIDRPSKIIKINNLLDVIVKDNNGDLITISLQGYGADPKILEGDYLEPFQPLTNKIEIKDEVTAPRWWDSDYITILSPFQEYRQIQDLKQDQRRVLNEILKHNTFGVSIDIQVMREGGNRSLRRVSDFINDIKPSYSYAVIYSKLSFEDTPENFLMEDGINLEMKVIIDATILSNLKNKYSIDDNLLTPEMDMSKQNTSTFLERINLRHETLGNSSNYRVWSESSQFFEWEESGAEVEEFFDGTNFIFKKSNLPVFIAPPIPKISGPSDPSPLKITGVLDAPPKLTII